MKFISCGDFHITNNRPKVRKDIDYFQSILNKITIIYTTAVKYKINFVVQPGDFFDSHKASDFLKQSMIDMLLFYKNNYGITTLVIYGQHDLRFHNSDTSNTPLMVLNKAEAVYILNNKVPFMVENVSFYGASWNDEIIKPITPENKNILVTHRMIVKRKLWEAQEEFEYGPNMFRKHKYDFFITGDNHQHFTFTVNPKNKSPKHLINCGSLMRSTSIQTEHEPCFYIVDTEESTIQQVKIPVPPVEDVIDLQKLEVEKQNSEKLEAFIKAMKNQQTLENNKEGELNFIKALKERVLTVPENVAEEINNILDSVEN